MVKVRRRPFTRWPDAPVHADDLRVGESGQASVEYVTVGLVVSVVLAGAAALTSGGLGDSIAVALRRGICEAVSGGCPRNLTAAGARDFEACTLRRRTAQQGLSLDVAFVRLAGEMGLTVESLSDGRVRVSFADRGGLGAGAGAGAHFELSGGGASSEVRADAAFTVSSGRAWLLPDQPAAKRFVAAYGASQSLDGRIAMRLRGLCPPCGLFAADPPKVPPADERWVAGGLSLNGKGGLSAGPARASVDVALGAAAGRRERRDSTVWYLRADDRISGELDAIGTGIDGQASVAAVIALELGRDGEPRSLRITSERRASTRRGMHVPLALRRVVGRGAVGHGEVLESESLLSLEAPRDRELALRLIAGLRSADPETARNAARGLKQAMSLRGIATVRRYALTGDRSRIGAGAAVGLRLGLDVALDQTAQRLTAVGTRLPGLGWLPRADCLSA